MLKNLVTIWMLGGLVIVLASVWAQGQFMARLQHRHGAVWRALVRPRLLASDNSMHSLFRLLSYAARGEFRALGDRQMNLYGATIRYAIPVLFVWFCGGVLLLLVLGPRP